MTVGDLHTRGTKTLHTSVGGAVKVPTDDFLSEIARVHSQLLIQMVLGMTEVK
jgi:hypothetical protein